MNTEHHESFHRIIDESLAGATSAEGERSLRRHLETCSSCRHYLSASNRVIAGLGGFSFEVNPTLNSRVVAALGLRAQQIQAAQLDRRRWVLVSLAAFVLTMGGSFIDLQFGSLIAAVFEMQRTQVQQVLLAFWIVPSLCVLLLFPLMPLLWKGSAPRKERIL